VKLWRRAPLHERLAREAGLAPTGPVDTRPWWGEVGIHGVPRPREWDAVAVIEAESEGAASRFVALPGRAPLVEEGAAGVEPFAEAIDAALDRPYRAEAVRRPDGSWAVAARRIRVLELPGQGGDEIDLTLGADGRRLSVDGGLVFGSIPALEQLVAPEGHVHATRLDGILWEVQATRL
jgi:hypothetical protein